GATRLIDAGEFDGRLFVNVAGVGLDARVAHRFADGGPGRRGFARYAAITLDELFRFVPERLTISVDGAVIQQPTMLVAVANARQYGNGAIIAPQADLDDGRLDLVVVGARPALAAVAQ